jgi:hypothetical protein
MRAVWCVVLVAAALNTSPGISTPSATRRPVLRAVDSIPAADRIRLAEAFRLADALGDSIWMGWNRAPFGVLLITQTKSI